MMQTIDAGARLPMVSVIIPVYCMEEYLWECVSSVIGQTYKNIEVILVDDGSTDSSPQICDAIAAEDERVKVIHKKNGGLSSARNAGIQIAFGDYILFLDSDDFWDDMEALERLSARMTAVNADVLNFSYKKYDEDTGEKVPYFKDIKPMPRKYTDKENQLDFLTKNNLYIASACNKMIRRSLLDKEMEFCAGIYCEDIDWCARLLMKAESMDFVCENFYCYRQRGGSISHVMDIKKCRDLCGNIKKCAQLAKSALPEDKEYLYRYTAYQYGTFFKVQAMTEPVPVECIKDMGRYRELLSYHGSNKKLKALYLSCRTIGYEKTCALMRRIYGKKNQEY